VFSTNDHQVLATADEFQIDNSHTRRRRRRIAAREPAAQQRDHTAADLPPLIPKDYGDRGQQRRWSHRSNTART
jgi:hypothetical protein